VDFSWTQTPGATYYRIEIETIAGQPVLAALLVTGVGIYRAPSWLKDRAADGLLRWRVVALDQGGNSISETSWRGLRLVTTR
jgi:hypothetical protein